MLSANSQQHAHAFGAIDLAVPRRSLRQIRELSTVMIGRLVDLSHISWRTNVAELLADDKQAGARAAAVSVL
jgi:glutamyl-tRNA reductase